MPVASLVRPTPKRQIDPSEIINVEGASELYKVSQALIYKLVADRKIRFYRIPGTKTLRFLRSELLEDFAATLEGPDDSSI